MRFRVPGLAIVLFALALPGAVQAQCPDGTPPPCRTQALAPARVTIDENLIAIFPFRITGTSTDAQSLREGAMDLLSLALDEQAGLHVVSSRTLLARARNFTDASSVADAAAIARSLGAGAMILGNAVVVGTQLRGRAELHDLVHNRSPVAVEARGTSADPAPVIDSLASSIARVKLAAGAGTARRALSEYATSPAALRLFLAGERSARAGRWQEAADSLMRAIALDSTFALAMHRLRVANTFGAATAPWTATTLIVRALESPQRLPRRQLDILQTAYAEYEGNYRESIRRADALGTLYPDDAEASYEEGEAYFHVGLAFGERPERALEAMERTIRIDSTLIDPYNHAVELRMMTGDTTGALALARRGAAIAPTSMVHRAVLAAMRVIALHEDPAAVAAELKRLEFTGDVVDRTAHEFWRLLSNDPGRALSMTAAFERLAAAPDRPRTYRVQALSRLASVLVAQGRLREARDTASAALRLDPSQVSPQQTMVVAALLDGSDLAGAVQDLNQATAQRANRSMRTFGLLGMAAIRMRQPAALDSAMENVREIGRSNPMAERYATAVAATLLGLDALGRADTATAMRELSQVPGVLPYDVNGGSRSDDVMQWGMLALADLERARGMNEQALSRLSFFTFATGVVPLRMAADSLRARIGAIRP